MSARAVLIPVNAAVVRVVKLTVVRVDRLGVVASKEQPVPEVAEPVRVVPELMARLDIAVVAVEAVEQQLLGDMAQPARVEPAAVVEPAEALQEEVPVMEQ